MFRVFKFVLAGILVAYLGWNVVKSSAVAALSKRQPQLAHRIAPEDPRVIVSLANVEFRVNKGELTPETLERLVRVYQKTPLAEEPLLFSGIKAMTEGGREKANMLFKESGRRAPRSRLARLFLLDRALHDGRIEEAADHIAVLTRLVPRAETLLIPELAKFAAKPTTRDNLQIALRRNPELRNALLSHLVTSGADIDLILSTAGASGGDGAQGNQQWLNKMLDRMVKSGDIVRARQLWRSFFGIPDRGGLIYDQKFQRLPGAPPFTWLFSSTNAGIAEPNSSGGLDIEYYGRESVELASQLLTLPPGRFRIAMRIAGNLPQEGPTVLRWAIVCHGSKNEIGSLPLQTNGYGSSSVRGNFTVPSAGCAGQWLRLLGEASEFPKTVTLTVTDLQLQ